MNPLTVGVGALLVMLGSGGCSSSNAEVELVSEARFPERFANIWCQSMAPCCASEQVAYDRAICHAQARDFAASMLANRVGGDTTYSAEAGTRCLSRLEHTLKSCEIEEASAACSLIFVGPSPEGTACANGSACASGYCAQGEAASSGVCAEASYQSPIHGQQDEPCVGSCGVPGSFQCPTSLLPSSEGTVTFCYAEEGLYCSFDSESIDALRCRPYAAVGEACGEADVRCIPGAFCLDGTCIAQQSSGPCADTPDLCNAQSFCDDDLQCQPKQPNGAMCLTGEECTSNSCSSDGVTEGVCDSGSTLTAQACSGRL